MNLRNPRKEKVCSVRSCEFKPVEGRRVDRRHRRTSASFGSEAEKRNRNLMHAVEMVYRTICKCGSPFSMNQNHFSQPCIISIFYSICSIQKYFRYTQVSVYDDEQ